MRGHLGCYPQGVWVGGTDGRRVGCTQGQTVRTARLQEGFRGGWRTARSLAVGHTHAVACEACNPGQRQHAARVACGWLKFRWGSEPTPVATRSLSFTALTPPRTRQWPCFCPLHQTGAGRSPPHPRRQRGCACVPCHIARLREGWRRVCCGGRGGRGEDGSGGAPQAWLHRREAVGVVAATKWKRRGGFAAKPFCTRGCRLTPLPTPAPHTTPHTCTLLGQVRCGPDFEAC